MPRPQKFSDKQIGAALRACGGVQVAAALALEQADAAAARAGGRPPRTCSRQLVNIRIKENPTLRAICEEAREELLDIAEGELRKGVQNGSENLIKFTLETLGKERGYTRKIEHGGSGPAGSIPIYIAGDDANL